jgi:hypothetical protein
MTNKELYNIVFEKFVQAKKELIREGYHKHSVNDVDFNEVFNKTKHQLQEAKIQSLQRENQMLKRKLQESMYSAAGQGSQFQGGGAGSKTFGKLMTKGAAALGDVDAKADVITDRMMEKGMISGDDVSKFTIKVKGFLKSGMNASEAAKKAMGELKAQTLAESKRRRK